MNGAPRGVMVHGVERSSWPAGTFLGRLRPQERDAVLALGHRRVFPAATPLVREGESDNHLVVLLAGRVRVTMTDADGRVTLLGSHGGGDVVGEMSVLEGAPRSATVTAVGEVLGVVVAASAFETLLLLHPGVSRVLLGILSQTIRLSQRHRQRGQRRVPARVADTLVELAHREGEPTSDGLMVHMTREELAQHVGAAPVTVIKTLTLFDQQGLLRRSRGKIEILRPDALSAMAGCP